MMKKFIYKGSVSCHVSLLVNKEIKDFSLHQNEEYELPESEPFVKSLQAQGLLVEKIITKKLKK